MHHRQRRTSLRTSRSGLAASLAALAALALACGVRGPASPTAPDVEVVCPADATACGGVRGALRLVGSRPADDPLPLGRAVVFLRGEPAPKRPAPVLRLVADGFEGPLHAVGPTEGISVENHSGLHHRLFWIEDGKRVSVELAAGASAVIGVPREGLARIYCELHPEEHVTVFASPSPHFQTVDFGGSYRLDAVGPGTWTLEIWSQTIDGPIRPIEIEAGKVADEDIWIDPSLARNR